MVVMAKKITTTKAVVKPALLTAAEAKKNCPAPIEDWAKRIAVLNDKLAHCEDKANQYKIAISQLLAKVKDACDTDGFAVVRERFFPKLGRSRVYELLQIASGKKTPEEIKSAKRESVRKHRAAKKSAEESTTVVDETVRLNGGQIIDIEKFSPAAQAQIAKVFIAPTEPTGDAPADDTVENDYAGMRQWFEDYIANAVLYFLDSRVPDMPPKMFCGFASSDDLRSLADYLLRVADEESKEASSGDPVANDQARRAAYAVVWAREQ
jgi:hypothetical protein